MRCLYSCTHTHNNNNNNQGIFFKLALMIVTWSPLPQKPRARLSTPPVPLHRRYTPLQLGGALALLPPGNTAAPLVVAHRLHPQGS